MVNLNLQKITPRTIKIYLNNNNKGFSKKNTKNSKEKNNSSIQKEYKFNLNMNLLGSNFKCKIPCYKLNSNNIKMFQICS